MSVSKVCVFSKEAIEDIIKKDVVEHLTDGCSVNNLTVEFEIARYEQYEELIKATILKED